MVKNIMPTQHDDDVFEKMVDIKEKHRYGWREIIEIAILEFGENHKE